MFTLRSINTTAITSCDSLKRVIKEQLKQEIVSDIRVFDVGFVQGSNVVSIRSAEDFQEVFSDILRVANSSCKVMLWCDGLREEMVSATGHGQKCGYNWDSEEDSESEECRRPKKKKKKAKSREDKENKVQYTVDHLKEQHGSKFTSMQLRIWAEMITGGMYTSKESPPNTTMFTRAGGQSKKVSEQSPSSD